MGPMELLTWETFDVSRLWMGDRGYLGEKFVGEVTVIMSELSTLATD